MAFRSSESEWTQFLVYFPRVWGLGILYEKGIEFKLSGNEFYYTNSLILLVENMLCSRLHSQIVSI